MRGGTIERQTEWKRDVAGGVEGMSGRAERVESRTSEAKRDARNRKKWNEKRK